MSYEISEAIYNGDVQKLEDLEKIYHERNLYTEITQSDHWNLLHNALLSVSSYTPTPMIEHLIKRGVDINGVDRYGNTPLHYAARAKYTEAMRLLLDAGASVDSVNADGVTPLRQTLISKPYSIEATELLLFRGADPDRKGKTGKTVRDRVNIIAHGPEIGIRELFDKYKRV